MLSTKHLLDPEENYNARSNALTAANGLKFCWKTTPEQTFVDSILYLCKIRILEILADGQDIEDPRVMHDPKKDIIKYLPTVIKGYMTLSNDSFLDLQTIQGYIVEVFGYAYTQTKRLYPHLEIQTKL